MSRGRAGRGQGKRAREMEYLFDRYKAAHPEEDGGPIEPHVIAPWAIRMGLWRRPPITPEETLRQELAKHLASQYITDPQEREVRKNHAIFIKVTTPDGVKRRSRWYTLFQAPPDHMRQSAQLRRRAALADVAQLELDLDSYNDNNIWGVKLPPMDFNFNPDLAERKMPTQYPDEAPDAESEGDDEA